MAQPAMQRKQRTNGELQKASTHLHYEVQMLRLLAEAMESGIATEGWLANALLESFVIHVRAVVDFLYKKDQLREDDVVAQDFFSSPDTWWSILPKLSEVLEKTKKRVDKEAAHLTYARLGVTPSAKQWQFGKIANEVGSVMQIFLKRVPIETLGAECQRLRGST